MLTKEEVAEQMEASGYDPVEETIDGHSFWRSPCGLHLLVPEIGPDKLTCQRWLLEQMSEIEVKGRGRAN